MEFLQLLCICMLFFVTIVIMIAILASSSIMYDLFNSLMVSLDKQSL